MIIEKKVVLAKTLEIRHLVDDGRRRYSPALELDANGNPVKNQPRQVAGDGRVALDANGNAVPFDQTVLNAAGEEVACDSPLGKKIEEEHAHHEAHSGQVFFRAIGNTNAGQVTREEFAQAFIDLGFLPNLKLASDAKDDQIKALQDQVAVLTKELEATKTAAVAAGAPAASLRIAGTVGVTGEPLVLKPSALDQIAAVNADVAVNGGHSSALGPVPTMADAAAPGYQRADQERSPDVRGLSLASSRSPVDQITAASGNGPAGTIADSLNRLEGESDEAYNARMGRYPIENS